MNVLHIVLKLFIKHINGVSKDTINDHGLLIISPYALVDNFNNDYRLKLVKILIVKDYGVTLYFSILRNDI